MRDGDSSLTQGGLVMRLTSGGSICDRGGGGDLEWASFGIPKFGTTKLYQISPWHLRTEAFFEVSWWSGNTSST